MFHFHVLKCNDFTLLLRFYDPIILHLQHTVNIEVKIC